MNSRKVDIDGVNNARTIGEIENQDGKILKPVFYRSAGLHDLTDIGISELKALGITDILDLRSTGETTANPDNIGDLNSHHVPILDFIHADEETKAYSSITTMEGLYELILENYPQQFKKVFDVLASINGRSKVLYHCTVGKDRTGLLSMFLLSIAGVGRNEIAEDYALTGNVSGVGPQNDDMNSAPSYLFDSPKTAMLNTLDWLDDKYGGPINYLLKAGVDEDQQSKIRQLMGI